MKKLLKATAITAVLTLSSIAVGATEGSSLYENWTADFVNVTNNGKVVGKLNYQIDGKVINSAEFKNWARKITGDIYKKSQSVTLDANYVAMVLAGELHTAVRTKYGNNDIYIRYGDFEKM